MRPLNKPTRWNRFWAWVDRDFDDVRPWSLAPLMAIPSLPLGFAFAVDASNMTAELTRAVAIAGAVVVLSFYLYRQLRNLIRYVRRRCD